MSTKALDRIAVRSEKEKRGVYISSKDKKKSKSDDDYDRNYDSKYRRDRDRNRDKDRDRDRDYDRRRDRSERDKDRSRHSHRSDRKRASDSERSLHTPRFKDEPRTPYAQHATASSSWDDDDEKMPAKKSSWDFPTPKEEKRSEWSTRSNTSSIYRMKKSINEEDTPRPTPAHKFNAWANDRKQTGATPHTSKFNNYINPLKQKKKLDKLIGTYLELKKL